jgi:outer membrane protein assembly factor BamB
MKRVFIALAVLSAVSGCAGGAAPAHQTGSAAPPASSTAPGASSTAAPSAGADWFTYHGDAARSGAPSRVPPVGRPAMAWRARLDGAVYGQPLVIGDTVIAATEHDTVYALDRRTGGVRWKRHVGIPVPLSALPCGNIDPLGITGTPVYDPSTRRVFAVAETTGFHHVLVGLAVSDGTVQVSRDIPTPDGRPQVDQQRAALALTHDRVYVAFGGLNGDCGPYVGSVVGVPTTGKGSLISYRVPSSREAGIWASGGPAIGQDGTLYVSVGNGAATSGAFDSSDSVTALGPDLRRRAVFAPRTWATDNASDLDLGSLTPALLPGGRILIAGKRGTAYLLHAPKLGGVGAQITEAPVCEAYGGPAHVGTTVYLPCMRGGTAAVDTAGDKIRVLWRGPSGAPGSPVVAGGAVWVVDWDGGRLYALNQATGKVIHKIDIGETPHFASPTLSGTLALVGTMNGVVAISGA